MDLRANLADSAPGDEPGAAFPALRCSAKGCRAEATWALRWNNPTLHTPERRKVWLACDEHEPTLREFLSMRGFHRDTVRPDELRATDG